MENVKQVIMKNIDKRAELTSQRKTELLEAIEKLEPQRTAENDTGYISFASQNKRMKIKIGRFLSTKLGLKGVVSDEILRNISEDICLELFGSCVKLCKGEEITKNYEKSIGGGSCMTGGSAEYTKLFEMNPEKFQQAICFLGNDSARAIVSLLDNKNFLMDRIYATCDKTCEELINYALKQYWFYKNGGHIYKNKEVVDIDSSFKVSGLIWQDGNLPYMDTLKYYTIERSGKMTISAYGGDYEGVLNNTDGYLCRWVCSYCDDAITSEDDRYTSPDGDDLCEHCYSEHTSTCEVCNETVWNDNSTYLGNLEIAVCDSCLEDYTQCCECDNWQKNDKIKTIDGKDYCKECADNMESNNEK